MKLNDEVKTILTERFGKDTLIALATESGGTPYVRAVNAYYEDGSFYVITHALSNKMRQLAQNPSAAIAGEWFTAHGTGIDLGYIGREENRRIAGKLKDVFASWLDNGHVDLGDENTVVLRIALTDGVLLSQGTRYEVAF